jgi:hypothetical protein
MSQRLYEAALSSEKGMHRKNLCYINFLSLWCAARDFYQLSHLSEFFFDSGAEFI